MAASDGDSTVWPTKHCHQKIPLFIHKPDPLGPRRQAVHLLDMNDVYVRVVVKDGVCVHAQKGL